MENAKERLQNFLKFFNDNWLWIAIGFAVAVAAGVPSYLYRQKGANDFNEVWSRIYRMNFEISTAQQGGSGKRKRGRKPKPAEATVDTEAKANPTDPASRIMKSRKGYLQGYNTQAVVTQDQIVIAPGVTSQANDVHQLIPMIDKTLAVIEAVLGEEAEIGTAVMDAGYWSEDNAATETANCEYLIATTKDWKQRKALT